MKTNQPRKSAVLLCLLAALPLATANNQVAFAQTKDIASETSPASVQPPEHPITRAQFEVLEVRSGHVEAQKKFIRELMQGQREKMPAWFPQTVWDDFLRREEELDQISISLPIYQKYMSEETANWLLLFYQGDTGGALAREWTSHAKESVAQGYRGASAAEEAQQTFGEDSTVDSLMRKRLNELTPEQQTGCLNALQTLNSVLFRISDETDKAYRAKLVEIAKAVVSAHHAEIAAAQKAAAQ
ncbi:MAG: hypothetical protein ABSD72_09010 [Terracidiphilus sp.]|jgi:hypothetical protein